MGGWVDPLRARENIFDPRRTRRGAENGELLFLSAEDAEGHGELLTPFLSTEDAEGHGELLCLLCELGFAGFWWIWGGGKGTRSGGSALLVGRW